MCTFSNVSSAVSGVSTSSGNKILFVSFDAKKKHLGYKKVQGQSEATLQTGRCDQKVWYELRPRSYFIKMTQNIICNHLAPKKVAKWQTQTYLLKYVYYNSVC